MRKTRAPLILIHFGFSPGGTYVEEVNSKGVVGQSTVPTGPQVGTDRPTTHLRPSTPHTTKGNRAYCRPTRVRAGGFGQKTMPKTHGYPRADAKTTSQATTRPRFSFTWNARMHVMNGSCSRVPRAHTKVPDLTSGDIGSPQYRVCLSSPLLF